MFLPNEKQNTVVHAGGTPTPQPTTTHNLNQTTWNTHHHLRPTRWYKPVGTHMCKQHQYKRAQVNIQPQPATEEKHISTSNKQLVSTFLRPTKPNATAPLDHIYDQGVFGLLRSLFVFVLCSCFLQTRNKHRSTCWWNTNTTTNHHPQLESNNMEYTSPLTVYSVVQTKWDTHV